MPVPAAALAGSYNVTQVCNAAGAGAATGWHVAGCFLGSGATIILALSWIGTHLCGRRRRRPAPAPVLPTYASTSTPSRVELAALPAHDSYARPEATYGFQFQAPPADAYRFQAPAPGAYGFQAPAPEAYYYDPSSFAPPASYDAIDAIDDAIDAPGAF